jgi:hypothetical protein
MKIFEFQTGNVTDWVCSDDLEDAKLIMEKEYGVEVDSFTKIVELKDNLKDFFVVDTNEYYDDEEIEEEDQDKYYFGYKKICSFQDVLDEGERGYFASTEW